MPVVSKSSVVPRYNLVGGAPSPLLGNPTMSSAASMAGLKILVFVVAGFGVISTIVTAEACDVPLFWFLVVIGFWSLCGAAPYLVLSLLELASDQRWVNITLSLAGITLVEFLLVGWGTFMVVQSSVVFGYSQCLKCQDPVTRAAREDALCHQGDTCAEWGFIYSEEECPKTGNFICEMSTSCQLKAPVLWWFSVVVCVGCVLVMSAQSLIVFGQLVPGLVQRSRELKRFNCTVVPVFLWSWSRCSLIPYVQPYLATAAPLVECVLL